MGAALKIPSQERKKRVLTLVMILVAAMAVVVVGVGVYTSGYGPGPAPGGSGLMQATCGSLSNVTSSSVRHAASGGDGDHAYFLIVAADPPSPYAGFNGSYYAGTSAQWPTVYVHQGQVVSIRVINCTSGEAHGFAISFYQDNSIISIQPGHSYDVTFTATKTGTFRIYCDIFCAIHPFMQNGALIVT